MFLQRIIKVQLTHILSIGGEKNIMDVLKRIIDLREERHWTEYRLAEESGITQSTISAWFRKDTLPSIPSLEKICDAFGITLSQFFLEENEEISFLTEQQLELIHNAAKLTPEQFHALLHFLETI